MPDIGELLDTIRRSPGDALDALRRGSLPFRLGATSVSTGLPVLPQRWQGGTRDFVPRADRWFGLTVDIDLLGLPTLPERMEAILHERLVVNVGIAADKVLETAQSHLYKPADFPKHRHGVDTGLLKRTLVARLVEGLEKAVCYDLYSTDAAYWVFVEFGRLRPDGSWWPGYHFLTSAVMQNYPTIQNAARTAVHETFTLLASEARVPNGASMPPPSSVAPLTSSSGPAVTVTSSTTTALPGDSPMRWNAGTGKWEI
jgi:hypothetical protein